MLRKYWNNYCRYMDKHLESSSWSDRILFYFILLISLLGIFLVVFAIYKITALFLGISNSSIFTQYNTTELRNMGFFDNERYLISALVQSLAATIALVITLSLVAVQLAAQSYSARVTGVYKNNPDMWILLSIYIAVIFYGLGLLKVIDIGVAGINMEFAIFAAYFLGFFAFVCLVPYMLKTLKLLKPSKAIELLAEEITEEKVLAAWKNHESLAEIDPVQPVIDIINSALEINDYETIRNGLVAIKNSTFKILQDNQFKKGEEKIVTSHIISHLEKIGILTASKKNGESMRLVIITLEQIGIESIKLKCESTTISIIQTISTLGYEIFETNFRLVKQRIIHALGDIGLKSTQHVVALVQEELTKMGLSILNTDYDRSIIDVESTLKALRERAQEEDWNEMSKQITEALQKIKCIKEGSVKKRLQVAS